MNLKKWDSLLDIQRRSESGRLDFAKEYVALLEKFAPPDKYPCLLDVGCGNGVEFKLFSTKYKIIGITLGTSEFVCDSVKLMDVHDMQFTPESFDVVYSAQAMEHSYAPWLACLEIWVTLRADGIFFMVVPIPSMYSVVTHPNLLSQDQWAFILQHVGFKILHNEVHIIHEILRVPLIVIAAQKNKPKEAGMQKVIDKLVKIRMEEGDE